MNRPRPAEIRFWEKVDKRGPTECWPWLAAKDPLGYGRFGGRTAHRVAYEFTHGPVPIQLVLNHLCRNRQCVNPAHLEPVTNLENTMHPESLSPTRLNADKTECIRGHPYNEANTRHLPGNHRRCRICERLVKRAWAERGPSAGLSVRDSLNEALWAALLSLSVSARVLIQKFRPEAK